VIERRQKNQQFIEEYKDQRGYQRCGNHANLVALELHRHDVFEKDIQPSKLLLFGRRRLLQELEKNDGFVRLVIAWFTAKLIDTDLRAGRQTVITKTIALHHLFKFHPQYPIPIDLS